MRLLQIFQALPGILLNLIWTTRGYAWLLNPGDVRESTRELRGAEWKIFKEINMVNKDYQPLNTMIWKPVPSGLLGKVILIPLMIE